MKDSNYDNDGFLSFSTLWIGLSVTSVLAFTFWYIGAFDGLVTWLGEIGDIFSDGDLLGDWIGGVVVGTLVAVLRGLWDFGTDIGEGIIP